MPIKWSYVLLQSMIWMAGKTGVAAFLKKKNGRLPLGFSSPFEKMGKGHPAVVSCSNLVFSRPTDWNENIHQYGYWFVEEQSEYQPTEEFATFLAQGDRPVYR